VLGAVALTVRGLAFDAGPRGALRPGRAAGVASGVDERLDEFVRNTANGGPPKDGIPAIDRPVFVPASEGSFLPGTW
jgi:hypothetical protein